jgi:hypothetical protein
MSDDEPWSFVDSEGCYFETAADRAISSDADGLGWCGCGDQDRLVELLVSYLGALTLRDGASTLPDAERRALWDESYRRVDALGSDVAMLLGWACDRAGWTEHGSSIGGAWLTDKGRRTLTELEAALSTTEPSP